MESVASIFLRLYEDGSFLLLYYSGISFKKHKDNLKVLGKFRIGGNCSELLLYTSMYLGIRIFRDQKVLRIWKTAKYLHFANINFREDIEK